MKTDGPALLRALWRLFTEVPGWPDAPVGLRLRRSLPILLPAVGACLFVGWQLGYAGPRLRSLYASHHEVLELERDVAALRLRFSEHQVEELAGRETALQAQLPHTARDVREILRQIEREARDLGWQIAFGAPEVPERAAAPDAVVLDVPVRGRLKPAAGNADPFKSLLAVLERCSTPARRIALMRINISADEGKWQTVEIGLRFVVPVSHAKTSQ